MSLLIEVGRSVREMMLRRGLRAVVNLHEVEGFGVDLLPAATVRAGRHPEGSDIEEIYGMSELTNNSLMRYYEMVKREADRQKMGVFFQPVAVHGSYRFNECPKGGEPEPTEVGKRSIRVGVWGRQPEVTMDAWLLMPITEDQMKSSLGSDWVNDYMAVNDYLMRIVAAPLPIRARGFYG